MNSRCTDNAAEPLGEFRQQIYESFPKRRDATMNLLDSLCANTVAGSVVELSLNVPFDRKYSSLHDAIDNFAIGADGHGRTPEDEARRKARTTRARIVAQCIPPPSRDRLSVANSNFNCQNSCLDRLAAGDDVPYSSPIC